MGLQILYLKWIINKVQFSFLTYRLAKFFIICTNLVFDYEKNYFGIL